MRAQHAPVACSQALLGRSQHIHERVTHLRPCNRAHGEHAPCKENMQRSSHQNKFHPPRTSWKSVRASAIVISPGLPAAGGSWLHTTNTSGSCAGAAASHSACTRARRGLYVLSPVPLAPLAGLCSAFAAAGLGVRQKRERDWMEFSHAPPFLVPARRAVRHQAQCVCSQHSTLALLPSYQAAHLGAQTGQSTRRRWAQASPCWKPGRQSRHHPTLLAWA